MGAAPSKPEGVEPTVSEKQSQQLSSFTREDASSKPSGPPPTAELLTSRVADWQTEFEKGQYHVCCPCLS